MMGTSLESYAHKAAKQTVLGWLREGAEQDAYHSAAGLSWRVNRCAPWFGVWEEYPITCPEDIDAVWDERGDWLDRMGCPEGRQPIPTYTELIALGTPPKIIFDIAIQHKGFIPLAIEIVHKNGLTDAKRQYLEAFYTTTTLVVSAGWVLAQVRRPDRMVVLEAINLSPCSGNKIETMSRRCHIGAGA